MPRIVERFGGKVANFAINQRFSMADYSALASALDESGYTTKYIGYAGEFGYGLIEILKRGFAMPFGGHEYHTVYKYGEQVGSLEVIFNSESSKLKRAFEKAGFQVR